MKTLFTLILFTSISAFALKPSFVGKPALHADQVQFVYEPYDDGASAPCIHTVSNPDNPYDLTVKCTDSKGLTHAFTAHLALSTYTHPTAPEISYELMYWVNDNGATTWFNFEKATKLMTLESSQSLPSEAAGLRLKITL
jgi:hypothetical protein